jgi:hypothetical protein
MGASVTANSEPKGTQEPRAKGGLTAITLLVIAGLHVAWGLGASFPFQSRADLADSVVGTNKVPSTKACMAVAALLVLAAMLVTGVVPVPQRLRAVGLRVVMAVLTTRGVAGALGRTSTLSPGSDSPAFMRLDKRLYSPLCLWLAAGVRRSI